MRVSFNWLKNYVDIRTSPEAVAEQLTMAGLEVTSLTRVEQEAILEIEVTPNRTDCLSIVGIAREVAAICGKKLKMPKIPSFRGKSRLSVPIQIQEKKQCLRYIGRVIRNVKVGPSPVWLIQRLEAMGIHAVNNIVDITNFCLLEFGQPLHAFDLDRLQGPRIIVRRSRQGEEIVTIDGVKRQLQADMLVIADKANPVAIAGVMGGRLSEVSEATTTILLESAYFSPSNIHNTSRKLGLATQSSYRFERGVDLAGVLLGSLRATELIQRLARPDGRRRSKPVVIGRLIDKGLKRVPVNKVRLRNARVSEILGTEVSPAQIKQALRRLQFSIVRRSKKALVVSIPSFRPDISREADLIEEVARLYGYDKIPLSAAQLRPNLSYTGRLTLPSEETYDFIRQVLSTLGLNEVLTYSLISRQALRKLELPLDNTITIKNPLSYEQEILRPTLLAGMLNSLVSNINRKNLNLRLFELSRVYTRQDGQPAKELTDLCIGIAGKRSDSWMQKQTEFCFFDLKGIAQTLLDKLGVENFRFAEGEFSAFISGRCANVFLAPLDSKHLTGLGEESYGFLGEIKREILDNFDISCPVYVAELKLHKLLEHIRRERRFTPLARFPSIERDVSLIAPQEVRSEQIVSLINKIGREGVTKVTLFDQYFGEQIPQGFRGLAYCLEYRSCERTLTAEEVDKLHRQIRQALAEELKVQVR